MEVIVIREENHGFIGVAKDYKAAVEWLIEDGWMYSGMDAWNVDTCSFMPVEIFLGADWMEHIEDIPHEFWENCGFYFQEVKVH